MAAGMQRVQLNAAAKESARRKMRGGTKLRFASYSPFFALWYENGYVPEMVHILKKIKRALLGCGTKYEKIEDWKPVGT